MTNITEIEADTLQILVAEDRALTAEEIGRASGLCPQGNPNNWSELGKSLVRKLLDAKAATKAGRDPLRYEVTERGRIASALWRYRIGRQA